MIEGSYTFAFERTRPDFWDVLRIVSPKIWGWWRPWFNCGLLLAVAMALGITTGYLLLEPITEANSYSDGANAVKVAAIVAASVALLLPLLFNALFKPKLVISEGDFLAPREVMIDAVGIQDSSNNVNRHYQWAGIIGFDKGKRGWLLRIDHADGIYIPYSAAPEEFDRHAFQKFLTAQIKLSQ